MEVICRSDLKFFIKISPSDYMRGRLVKISSLKFLTEISLLMLKYTVLRFIKF